MPTRVRRTGDKESNKDEDIMRKWDGKTKEDEKIERKEETEKEYGVRFPVTIKVFIYITATHTGTHIIRSSSQK
jgi:hypothetical protein